MLRHARMAVVGVLCSASAWAGVEPRLLRTPDIRGDTLVFSYAGDVWVSRLGAPTPPRRLTHHPGAEVSPKLSPDGRWVAFTGSYDGRNPLYLVSIDGGEPRRLTHGADATALGWTPDGRIAYRSTAGSWFTGTERLWFVEPGGGLPTWTPIAEVGEASFFPEGRAMAYSRDLYQQYLGFRHYGGGMQGRLCLYDFADNTYRELPSPGGGYSPMVVGRSLYFTSDRNRSRQNLYRFELDTQRETRLTHFEDADIRWPSTDGQRIVWERDGYLEVYDLATGKLERQRPPLPVEELRPRPERVRLDGQVTQVSLSPSGRQVAIEARGELFTVPTRPGAPVNLSQSAGARERAAQWSPDGGAIAYLSDASGEWEVYTRPGAGGQATQLTSANGLPFNGLRWSRNGKRLALTTLTNELYVLDVETRALTRVPMPRAQLASSDWSADSRWLAFTFALIPDTPLPLGTTPLGSLYFYEVETGRLTQVTSGYYDSLVAFDANGQYLYVQSARTFTPDFGTLEYSLKVERADRIYVIPLSADAPHPLRPREGPARKAADSPATRIDFEGLAERAVPLPMPAGDHPEIFGASNGVLYLSRSHDRSELTLSRFDFATQKAQAVFTGTLQPGVGPRSAVSFNADRSRVAVLTSSGLSVVDVKPGANLASGRLDLAKLSALIDPREEWRQIFWEAWRFQRDTFYDPKLRGVDWGAIGRHYAEYLPGLTRRSDLSHLLLQMIGELGTSHSFVSDPRPAPSSAPPSVGHLGADYEAVGEHVRFKRIYRGQNFDEARQGPLGEPGVHVREGEYLLAIDGKPVSARVSPGSLLLGQAGKDVTLTVHSQPTMEGARRVRVRPIEDETTLRYADWVEANRRYVARRSGGRIGYLHLPDTWTGGAVEFIRGFYGQTHLDALVIDGRYNQGGLAQPFIVPTLARKPLIGAHQRNGPSWMDTYAHAGPKVFLTNEFSGSGGDLLPWMFKRLDLGPVMGRRTAGMFTGYFERLTHVDGGSLSAAQLRYFEPTSGALAPESFGMTPDLEVDLRPDRVARGEDPQLDAAIQNLLTRLGNTPGAQK